jgi:YesN/AraC family two-component response regulator
MRRSENLRASGSQPPDEERQNLVTRRDRRLARLVDQMSGHETARYLLETTRLSVDEIARKVGYAEPSTLRRLIRRDTKHSPGHFRPAA